MFTRDQSGRSNPTRNALSWSDGLAVQAVSSLNGLPRSQTPTDIVFGLLEKIERDMLDARLHEAFHPLTMSHVVPKSGYMPVEEAKVDGQAYSLKAFHDGTLAVGTLNRRIVLNPLRGLGKSEEELEGHSGGIFSIDILPDGRIASAGADCQLLVWERRGAQGGWSSKPVPWCSSVVSALQVLPGYRVLVACDDGSVRLGDLFSERFEVLQPSSTGRVVPAPYSCVQMAQNGRIVAGRDSGDVTIWQPTRAGWDVSGFIVSRAALISCVQSLGSQGILTGGSDLGLLLHTLQDGTWGSAQLSPIGGGWVNCMQALPDGRIVFGTTRGDIWIVSQGGGDREQLVAHDGQVRAIQAFPDGRLVSCGDDGRVVLWDGAQAAAGQR